MGDPARVVFCTSSRSERGMIEPLLRRLDARYDLKLLELPVSFGGAYEVATEYLRLSGKPRLAFTPFDRLEMLACCIAFYQAGVPIAQLHAGDWAGGGIWDDTVRMMITLCSDIQFCASQKSLERTVQLLKLADKPISRAYMVGSIQFDDLELDESVVPKYGYDLVLYNPPNGRLELIPSELDEVEGLLDSEKLTVWVYPNEDAGCEAIIGRIERLELKSLYYKHEKPRVKGFKSLPRPQYLALMKHADRVIGNSSSFFVELPYFKKTHVHVGLRNRDRERVEPVVGGSDRVVEVVASLIEDL